MFKKKETFLPEEFEEKAETEGVSIEEKGKKKAKIKKEKLSKKEREKIDWGVTFKNKRSIGILIMVLALVCAFFVNPSIEYLQSRENVIIYMAQDNIEKGKEITEEMIRKVTTPRSSIVEQLVFEESPVGKYSKTAIYKDEPITSSKLSVNMPFKDEYLYSLEDGQKAISVAVSSISASLSAKIKPDDIVTVYAYIDDTRENDTFLATQPVELQYVKVLSVSDGDGNEVATTGDVKLAIPATVTFLVNNVQAKVLVGLERNSAIHLAVATRGNKEKAEELLQIQTAACEQAEQAAPEPIVLEEEVIE